MKLVNRYAFAFRLFVTRDNGIRDPDLVHFRIDCLEIVHSMILQEFIMNSCGISFIPAT